MGGVSMISRSFGLLVATLLLPALLFAAEEPPPQYQDSWASCGTSPCYPIGMAADGSGHLYVVDLWNNIVRHFNPDGSLGGTWGLEGTDPGEIDGAQGLDYDGSFYIADTGNNRVQKFSSVGTLAWATGVSGTGNGQFDAPADVAVDGSGNVYVVDRGNHRIQKLDSSGGYVTQWGGQGSGTDQFNVPRGIGVDGSGRVYVADSQNHRVMRYNSDGSGASVFVVPGVNEGQVADPSRIDVDGSGNVYVVDRGSCDKQCRVQKFSPAGTVLAVWGSDAFGCTGDACNGRFLHALDVAVSDMGSIYVSDLRPIDPVLQGRIQQFSSTVPARPITWGRLKARYP
jgi:sugar lactone lactonase YvrE